MITRFDHIMIAVRDLDMAIEHYQRLGFQVTPGGTHAQLGTQNALIQFGLGYFELVATIDPVKTMQVIPTIEIVLDILDQRDSAIIGLALASNDLQQDIARLNNTKLAVTPPYVIQRERADKDPINVHVFMPGGFPWRRPWPFLYQWEKTDQQRLAEEDMTPLHQNGITGITRVAVGIAPHNFESTVTLYQREFGLTLDKRDYLPRLNAQRATFRVGTAFIDLLAPGGEGQLQTDLSEIGEGVFEIELTVNNLKQSQAFLARQDITTMLDAAGPSSLLIDPRQTFGTRYILIDQQLVNSQPHI